MAAAELGFHGKMGYRARGRPCDGLGEAEAHRGSNRGGGEVGELLWPEYLKTAACGSGELSGKLASSGVLFVFDWKGESTEKTAARRVDKERAAGSLTGHAGEEPWPARVSGLRCSSLGRTNRGWGGGKCGAGVLQGVSGRE